VLCAPQSELYEARMKQANCLDLLGRDPQDKYLEAAAHHPERAEPLYECVPAPHITLRA